MSVISPPTCSSCSGAIEPEFVTFGSDRCRACSGSTPSASAGPRSFRLERKTASTEQRQALTSQGVLIWAGASAGLMLIGSFGPWVKVLGISASGTDGHNDGWLVVGAALIGALLLFTRRTSHATGVWLLLAGLSGAAVTVYDRHQVSSAISDAGPLGQGLAQVGWGLNLAMAASISLGISGLVWLNKGT